MIDEFVYSLENNKNGYAHFSLLEKKYFINLRIGKHKWKIHLYTKTHNVMTFFFGNMIKIPLDSEYSPFTSIEEVLEELIIHELIHVIGEIGQEGEKTVDRWHVLLCWLDSKDTMPEEKRCKCSIDCFWRDITN